MIKRLPILREYGFNSAEFTGIAAYCKEHKPTSVLRQRLEGLNPESTYQVIQHPEYEEGQILDPNTVVKEFLTREHPPLILYHKDGRYIIYEIFNGGTK